MATRFNSVVIASCIALSALADKAHDVFTARRDTILAQTVTVCGEVAFSVGRATSPRGRGDAVGYAKAEEQAKWNFGDKFKASAVWPSDIDETEKESAWVEYRCQHPERFSVLGMQRILSKKTSPSDFLVVLSFPADQVAIPQPTATELKAALDKVRERKRIVQEPVKTPEKKTVPKPQDGNVKRYDNFNIDIML